MGNTTELDRPKKARLVCKSEWFIQKKAIERYYISYSHYWRVYPAVKAGIFVEHIFAEVSLAHNLRQPFIVVYVCLNSDDYPSCFLQKCGDFSLRIYIIHVYEVELFVIISPSVIALDIYHILSLLYYWSFHDVLVCVCFIWVTSPCGLRCLKS